MKNDLDEALIEYSASDVYPFHMPGHKRQRLGDFTPEEIDITEVEGFDNLHHAQGILLEGQKRLARVFGADESIYLINGSTAGILAAVCGCMKKGGRLLIARNCHEAVYHAAYLMEAELAYLWPALSSFAIGGSIDPAQAEEALQRFADVQAVVITSPTYDGVVSDIRAIADVVHARDIPLIVDEAHGAHFGFAESFLPKAIALGADLCVESLHKTLPAYTQSAALHMMRTRENADAEHCSGEGAGGREYRFDAASVRRYLDIFQSSSPSYVLMAGIDRCVRMIEEDEALYRDPAARSDSMFGRFEERLRGFYARCGGLRRVQVFPGTNPAPEAGAALCEAEDVEHLTGIYARDPSKILISAARAGLCGQQLYDLLLEKYHLQMEMAAGEYVIALTSVMDTDEGFARLACALEEIDREAAVQEDGTAAPGEAAAQEDGTAALNVPAAQVDAAILYGPREKRLEIAQAMDAETVSLPLAQAAGRISAEYVCLYPPGTPILVPGEVISDDLLEQLGICKDLHMHIQGMQDLRGEEILVVV